jgi:DNA-binding GntR family transcriptional regulator
MSSQWKVDRDGPAQQEPTIVNFLHREILKDILRLGREEAWQPDTAVAEKPLAERLGVSRTPVRRALIALADQGLLRRQPGKGFILNRKIDHRDAGSVTQADGLPDELYRRILADRISGRLANEISESELITRYSVGRGNLRKALQRLSGEGIIHRQRGHGWRFGESLDSPRAILESYAFREAVETAALQQPDYTIELAELDCLRAAHEQMVKESASDVSPETWFRVNTSFHETLASWSDNRFFLQAVKRQNALRQMHQFADFAQLNRSQIVRSCREHLAILEALTADDRATAVKLLRDHLRGAAAEWEDEV